jgi:hypothetical protein
MTSIFETVKYWSFDLPNYEEILEFSNRKTESDIDNSLYRWGKNCEIDRIPISAEEFKSILHPSIQLFSDIIGKRFKYSLHDPWINLYKRGYYQELHTHEPADMSCVIFLNTGEDFSKFYFFNRNDISYSKLWRRLVKIEQKHYPEIKDGTIIFFPASSLHGVTKHRNDEIRKTIACNLDLEIL